MKKIIVLFLFFACFTISYADVIPSNSHRLNKCVKIINADDFSEYSLLGYLIYPTGEHFETLKIHSDECIDIRYQFNSLTILAVKKIHLTDKNIDTIDWLNDKRGLKAYIQIDCDGGYVQNDNPISSVDEYYKIISFTDTSVVLYKCKEFIRFVNGQPAVLKTYTYHNGKTSIDQITSTEDDTGFIKGLAEMCSGSEVLNFLIALLYTIGIETIILFLFAKTVFKKSEIKNKLLLLTGIVASFSTLPYVWFVLPHLIKPTLTYIVISEASVMFVESIIMMKLLKIDYKKSLMLSVLCNLISFLAGLGITLI